MANDNIFYEMASRPAWGEEMNKVYLLVGVPSSGKSWIMNLAKDRFCCVHHDDYINNMPGYIDAIAAAAENSRVLAETPFSISRILDPLESQGFEVIPIVVAEHEEVLMSRYLKRGGKAIPQGHLTRQRTYLERADTYGFFNGTSTEVIDHLLRL